MPGSALYAPSGGAAMLREASCTVSTEAGLYALWAPEPFAGVRDDDTWNTELGDDAAIRRHVVAGHLVPVDIGSGGAATFVVRAGGHGEPARLSERETRYLLVSSRPYLLTSRGRAVLGGIEDVAAETGRDQSRTISLARGRYAVTVHLIDWKAEPGAVRHDGTPAGGALPDFVVLLNPAGPATRYREDPATFGPLP